MYGDFCCRSQYILFALESIITVYKYGLCVFVCLQTLIHASYIYRTLRIHYVRDFTNLIVEMMRHTLINIY